MAYRYPYDEEEKKYVPPKLPTNRSMWKLMILNVLTLGIYSIIFFIPLCYDLDKVAPQREKKMMSYLFAYVLSLFTFSLVMIAWMHQFTERVEEALTERGISYSFSPSTFWSWYFFGSLIVVGPWVYFHRLCTAMNLLCEDYNKQNAAK